MDEQLRGTYVFSFEVYTPKKSPRKRAWLSSALLQQCLSATYAFLPCGLEEAFALCQFLSDELGLGLGFSHL